MIPTLNLELKPLNAYILPASASRELDCDL